jgi:hypothetical protein
MNRPVVCSASSHPTCLVGIVRFFCRDTLDSLLPHANMFDDTKNLIYLCWVYSRSTSPSWVSALALFEASWTVVVWSKNIECIIMHGRRRTTMRFQPSWPTAIIAAYHLSLTWKRIVTVRWIVPVERIGALEWSMPVVARGATLRLILCFGQEIDRHFQDLYYVFTAFARTVTCPSCSRWCACR